MSELTQQEFQSGMAQFLMKSLSDPDFSQLCRSSPGQAFRAAFGAELPEGCTLRFVGVDKGEVLVELPPWNPQPSSQELADWELDSVQGGSIWSDISGAFTTVGNDISSGLSTANDYMSSHTDGLVNWNSIGINLGAIGAGNLAGNLLWKAGMEAEYAGPIGVGLVVAGFVGYSIYTAVKH